MPEPVPVADLYADVIAALVDAAPPLTGEQRDRLASLLRYQPHVPAPRAPRSVASARLRSRGLSVGSSATPSPSDDLMTKRGA